MDALGDNSTISDCNNTFTLNQKNHLLMAKSSTGLVSFIMCLIAVSLLFCMRLYKYFTYRLAMYQILSSLFFSIIQVSLPSLLNYDSDYHQQIACKTIAFLIQYFVWIKLLFTLCLVFHLFCLTVCLKNFKKLEISYIIFSVLFPALFCWIPFIHNSYGVAGGWCWIREWKNDCATQKYLEGIIEQFVLWYGPLFISLTLTVAAVFIILIVFAQRAYKYKNSESECLIKNREHQNKKAIMELLPLLAYPVIFYILSIFPIINRVYSAISSNPSFKFALVHALCEASWGFFSSLALIMHILLARRLKKKRVHIQDRPISGNKIVDNGTIIYTTYTEASTNAKTKYSVPAESDIDDE